MPTAAPVGAARVALCPVPRARVVLLRDCTRPPGTKEFIDTLDPDNPEGGWVRFVFLRIFETNRGYTSTLAELTAACRAAAGATTAAAALATSPM